MYDFRFERVVEEHLPQVGDTITTEGELDLLPTGSVIVAEGHIPRTKTIYGWGWPAAVRLEQDEMTRDVVREYGAKVIHVGA
jgi:hypothetical protein